MASPRFTRPQQLNVRSFGPPALQALERRQDASGAGDLIIEGLPQRAGKGRSPAGDTAFLAVADVVDLERRLRALADR